MQCKKWTVSSSSFDSPVFFKYMFWFLKEIEKQSGKKLATFLLSLCRDKNKTQILSVQCLILLVLTMQEIGIIIWRIKKQDFFCFFIWQTEIFPYIISQKQVCLVSDTLNVSCTFISIYNTIIACLCHTLASISQCNSCLTFIYLCYRHKKVYLKYTLL